jgi:hypothetical protein
MKTRKLSFTFAATLLLAAGTFTGCESTDGGSTQVSSNVYYGVGFYEDPWYYGDYDHDHNHNDNVIVTPPGGSRPDQGLRPEQPIARPPDAGARPSQPIARPPDISSRPPTASQRPSGASQGPSARPTPSIPSTPRPANRGGGGGGGRGGGRGR